MRENFPEALKLVLAHEGGFVDDLRDPGGRTNFGVTQEVYDDWRHSQGELARDVKLLDSDETAAIYRNLYWDICNCDDLPCGVDYCMFDFGVNSGPTRAARYLQRALGLIEDARVGPLTIAAANKANATDLIAKLCRMRLDFLKQLSVFDRFGRGWTRRVEEVSAEAMGMAA